MLGLRSEDDSSQHVEVPKDKLLGGLLAAGFDERSCLSRYQSVLYGKALIREPSSYLISRLKDMKLSINDVDPLRDLIIKLWSCSSLAYKLAHPIVTI